MSIEHNQPWNLLGTWRYSMIAVSLLFSVTLILLYENPRILIFGPTVVPQQMLLMESIAISIGRVVIGGIISFGVALIVSLALFIVCKRQVFYPTLVFLVCAITPPPIWSTIVIMWLGIGQLSPIITIILSTVFMVTAINLFLLSQVPRRRLHIGELYSINVIDRVRYILLPEVKSGLALGLRLSLLVAWIALITAESFGASSGLGALLLSSRQLFDWKAVMAAWAAIVACALLTDCGVTSLGMSLMDDTTKPESYDTNHD